MSKEISSTTLMYSILSVEEGVNVQKDYLESGEVPDDEMDYEEEILGDLEQALMELIDVYKVRCKTDPELPSIDELLSGE
ncbi:MAG TPA: hypothetical protein DF614_05495 [Methylococcaceae bacterium]|nr:hypothetical protein [Methylococcaceae bacterium]